MIFLNSLLLFGAFAASVPLLIHLLNRNKVRVIPWAAMQFLNERIDQRSRRVRWQQWLLLAIRCAIPLLLAFVMSRPAVSWLNARLMPSTQPTFLIVDSSPSMLAMESIKALRGAVSDAKYEQATMGSIMQTLEMTGVRDLSPTPILPNASDSGSSPNALATTLDSDLDLQQFFDFPRMSLRTQLEELKKIVRENVDRQIRCVVVTDFQKSMIDQFSSSQRASLREELKQAVFPPELIFVPKTQLLMGGVERENISLHFQATSDKLVGLNQIGQVDLQVANHGRERVDGLSVQLTIDGRNHENLRVDVAAGESVSRSVIIPPLPVGDHLCQIRIDRTDSLAADNHANWVLQVVQPEPVLIIRCDTQRREESTVSADGCVFLQFAIEPPDFGRDNADVGTRLPRLFKVQGPFRANENNSIANALEQHVQHVILSNVPRLDEDLWSKIGEATENGSLVVFAGPDIDPRWYNEVVLRNQKTAPESGVLIVSNEQQKYSSSKLAAHPNLVLPLSRTVAGFFNATDAVTVARSWEMKSEKNDVEATASIDHRFESILYHGQDATVAAAFEKESGGRMLLFGFDTTPDQSSLPVSEVFVPLVQETLRTLIFGSQVSRNLELGEALPVLVKSKSEEANHIWYEYAPADVASEDNQGDQTQRVKVPQTVASRPLAYAYERGGDEPNILAATQIPPFESNLNIADTETIIGFVSELGGRLLESSEAADARVAPAGEADGMSRFSEVWRYVLIALLMLLFAELLAQQWLARRAA